MLGMMTEEDFLEHVGVKGMKWGKRKADSGSSSDSGGTPAKSRSELRGLNKASAKKDRGENDGSIDSARARIAGGDNRRAYKDAKAQYKIDKQVVGKREAAKAFTAVKEKNVDDYNKSQEAKSGRETVGAVVGGLAGLALYAAVSVASSRR